MIRFRYLESNQVTGTIPSEIGNLVYLENSYVYPWISIPSDNNTSILMFFQTQFLFIILSRYLNYNQLTGTIPSSIGNLVKLKWLYVLYFQFHPTTFIKAHFFQSNLFLLFLSDIVQISQPQSIDWNNTFINW